MQLILVTEGIDYIFGVSMVSDRHVIMRTIIILLSEVLIAKNMNHDIF